jgi:hypothetical protein
VSKPGPVARPAQRLRDAALDFAAAVDDSPKLPKKEWDRLVKAALFYQKEPKAIGRPPS